MGASGAAGSTRRYIIVDPALGRRQAIHAALLIGVSGAGCLALIPFTLRYGVRSIDLILLGLFYFLTLLGGTVGFHRLYAHRAFSAPAGVRLMLGGFASMAAQGPIIYWVANHRRHHWDSDGAFDPHSPHRAGDTRFGPWRGWFHAHFGWAFRPEITNGLIFGKGLVEDPVVRFLTRTYLWWVLAGLALPAIIGGIYSNSVVGAVAGFLWGGLARIFLVFNAASLVNSVCHMVGHSAHAVPNQSRNVWWLAMVTLGESWHNNHHAAAKAAIFAHHWWQLDIGGIVIRALASVGLASDVVLPKSSRSGVAGVSPQATENPAS